MSSASVDFLVLIDAPVPKHQARFYLRETSTELGPGAVCLVFSPTAAWQLSHQSRRQCHHPQRSVWPALINFKSDPSSLCVADKVLLASPQGRLQIIAIYWPFPSIDASPEGMDGRVRRGLSHRLSTYLTTAKSSATLLSYIQSTIQHRMHRHMTIPGNHSLCGGDLNCCWEGRPDGVGYADPLHEWADAIGYRSRHSDRSSLDRLSPS